MKFYILASGSEGNCSALVNKDNEVLLIDCGIAFQKIKERLHDVGLDISMVKKVLITHTHTDHIKSSAAFDPQDLYYNELSQMYSSNLFTYYQHLNLLGFDIFTLPSSHDEPGTTGFLIEYDNEKMAYITDTGYIHEDVQRIINNCNIYCIESNHDPRLLMMTRRPMFTKQRILSSVGHLSNEDCAYTLGNIMGPNTKQIVFLHKSKEANTDEMLLETFTNILTKMGIDVFSLQVSIAKQHEAISYLDCINIKDVIKQ